MLKDSLEELGLNLNEQAVYTETQRAGKISPARLSRITNINRTTVYSIGKKLAGLGLVTEDIGGKTHYLAALPPEQLEVLAKRDVTSAYKKVERAREAAKELARFTGGVQYAQPRIQFFEGLDLSGFIKRRTSDWDESMLASDKCFWGFQDTSYADHYQDLIDWYWSRAPREIELKFITNQASIEKSLRGKYERRHIQFWPHSDMFDGSLWIVGNYIVMLMTRERPHYIVEIHDPVLARNQRALFKGIWRGLDM